MQNYDNGGTTKFLASGPAKYEARLHSNFVCVTEGMYAGIGSGLNQINVSLCCMWRDKRGMWRGSCMHGELG